MQDDIFKLSEADQYHERRRKSNWSDEERIKEDLPLEVIQKNKIRCKNAAEVGAYNGFRLAFLSENYHCHAVAFEPSQKAILEGKQKYPQVDFRCNTAAQLDAADGSFDMVIVGYVFHWIDRKTLIRSISEIDRVLADDGWLVISDIWVEYPQRRKYHHLPSKDVWTYKQNYWEIYLASNCYKLVDAIFRKPSGKDSVPRYCTLLKKSLTGNYPVVNEDKE